MTIRRNCRCAAWRRPKQAGIAITLLPTLYAYGGFGGQPPAAGQRRFINDADSLSCKSSQTLDKATARTIRCSQLGISPHSLRAVTSELLTDVIAGLDAMRRNAPIHIHVAEQTKEVDDCLAWSGKRPVELSARQFRRCRSRWCAIHATHMTRRRNRGHGGVRH